MASFSKIGKVVLLYSKFIKVIRMTERSSSLWADDLVRSSIYLNKEAHSRLKEIAREEHKKVHDLIVEGIDSVIAKRGYTETARRNSRPGR